MPVSAVDDELLKLLRWRNALFTVVLDDIQVRGKDRIIEMIAFAFPDRASAIRYAKEKAAFNPRVYHQIWKRVKLHIQKEPHASPSRPQRSSP